MAAMTVEPPKKPNFATIYAQSGLGYGLIDTIAELAQVPRYVLNQMLMGEPVAPQDAEAVLRVINQHTGKQWTLSTVDIPVHPTAPPAQATPPTLSELRDKHHFDIAKLAEMADVHEIVVLSMLRGTAVYPTQAGKVLRALSHMTGERYTLDNVRVPLVVNEKEEPAAK